MRYGVTLLVTPPQAATKIMAGMAEWQKEWQNWRNGRYGYIRTIYGTHLTTTTTTTTMFNLLYYLNPFFPMIFRRNFIESRNWERKF